MNEIEKDGDYANHGARVMVVDPMKENVANVYYNIRYLIIFARQVSSELEGTLVQEIGFRYFRNSSISRAIFCKAP